MLFSIRLPIFVTLIHYEKIKNIPIICTADSCVLRQVDKPLRMVGFYCMKPRPYQIQAPIGISEKFKEGFKKCLLVLYMGLGKCHTLGTRILMYDGSAKKVEDIKEGDLLMGDDSTPRTVLSLARGREDCYNIIPTKGEVWGANKSHILMLQKYVHRRGRGLPGYDKIIVEKTVDEYNKLSDSQKTQHKQYRVSVEFDEKELPIEPYMLGIWLGDGNSNNTQISCPDKEVTDYFCEYFKKIGVKTEQVEKREGFCVSYRAFMTDDKKSNYLNVKLRELDLLNNKHIPLIYLANSRRNRLELLAGLLDTDGYYSQGCYEIATKFESLKDGICHLAGSLGYAVYWKCVEKGIKSTGFKGMYYRVQLSGDMSEVPVKIKRKKADIRKQKKDVLTTAIRTEFIGEQDYYGFMIDGNGRYLLGDFTVTHNTFVASNMIKMAVANRKRVLFIAHRFELIDQAERKFKKEGMDVGIIMAGFKEERYKPVQVASIQTLNRRDLPIADLVIVDEAHLSVSKEYLKILRHYEESGSFAIGLTATPWRTKKTESFNVFWDSFYRPITVSDAIEQGFVCESKVYACAKISTAGIKKTNGDFSEGELMKFFDVRDVYKNLIKNYHTHIGNEKTIVFCVNRDHSRKTCQALIEAGYKAVHIDAETPRNLRIQIISDFKEGKYDAICNVDILTAGFDDPTVMCIVLCMATSSRARYAQAVGRGSRILPEDEGLPWDKRKKRFYKVLDMSDNTARFGFAEDHFEISLEPQKTDDKKGVAPIRDCFQCGFMFAVQCKKCPECGAEQPIKKEKKTIKEEAFIELDRQAIAVRPYLNLPKDRWGEIPSDLLHAFAKAKGYKSATGWVKYQLAARGEGRKVVKIKNYSKPDYHKWKNWLQKAYYDNIPIDAATWGSPVITDAELIFEYKLEPKESVL